MYYNPYQQISNHQEVIRVNGRQGAEAYQMAPNSSVLLLDENAPIVWLKTTDGASYPTVTGYQISLMKESNPYSDLEDRIKRLEEVLNDKSNVGKVKTVSKSA